jgi:hypothetical protein
MFPLQMTARHRGRFGTSQTKWFNRSALREKMAEIQMSHCSISMLLKYLNCKFHIQDKTHKLLMSCTRFIAKLFQQAFELHVLNLSTSCNRGVLYQTCYKVDDSTDLLHDACDVTLSVYPWRLSAG